MDKLAEHLRQYNATLAKDYCPHASYYESMDFVEYITRDVTTVSDRIDEFLTLIWDSNFDEVVGFRLKGFKFIFNEYLKPTLQLRDSHFVPLVSVLEAVARTIGNALFEAENRERAYRKAMRLAERNEARLTDLPLAA